MTFIKSTTIEFQSFAKLDLFIQNKICVQKYSIHPELAKRLKGEVDWNLVLIIISCHFGEHSFHAKKKCFRAKTFYSP